VILKIYIQSKKILSPLKSILEGQKWQLLNTQTSSVKSTLQNDKK